MFSPGHTVPIIFADVPDHNIPPYLSWSWQNDHIVVFCSWSLAPYIAHDHQKDRNKTVAWIKHDIGMTKMFGPLLCHYNVIMSVMSSLITSLTIVYSSVYSGAHQRKHQSSASLAFVRGIHRWPVNSPHKWPVTRKMFPFDDVIMVFSTTISMTTGTINMTVLAMVIIALTLLLICYHD